MSSVLTEKDNASGTPWVVAYGDSPRELSSREGQWYLIHTRSKHERKLCELLAAQGIGHFLPLHERVQFVGNRKVKSHLPLFSSYLFLYGTRDQAFEADRTGRVAHLIEVPNQAGLQWELENLERVLREGVVLDFTPGLVVGARAEVCAGPFKGIQGIVDAKKVDRLILQIEVLGQSAGLEIDASLLKRIDH